MKTFLAAILGGIVVFVWNAVSWMGLSWHEPTLRQFSAPEQITQALVEQAPTSGIYLLNPPRTDATGPATPEEATADAPAAADGNPPFAFVAFSRDGVSADRMPRQLVYSLVANIVSAMLVVFLVRAATDLNYAERVLFIVLVAVIVAVAGHLPNWIWWHFPRDYMVIDIADVLIGWTLAAFAMAALTGPDNARPGLSYRKVRI